MVTEAQMLSQIEAANQFIDKNYLESLKEYRVHPLDERFKKHNLTRLYHINKIIYDKDEDINEKLVSVFHSVMPFCKNILLILKGNVNSVDLYLGIRSSQISNAATASDVLHDSFLGNFPGSRINAVKPAELPMLFSEGETTPSTKNIAYVNILPSERSSKQYYCFFHGSCALRSEG